MSNILITGSESGLGREMTEALRADNHTVFQFDIGFFDDVRSPKLPEELKRLDVLINNAGVNIINWLEDFEPEHWDRVMDTNAKGIYMMTRLCLPLLKESKGTIINVVSNASHMPMTCSLAYNASKGAAHIMTLQLARELTKKHGITVFGIAPNRLKGTAMSKSIDKQVIKTRGWTKAFARDYQRAALLTGEETPPRLVAEFVAFLLADKQRHRFLTGTVIPYGA